jgi:hypothetical protein
LICDLSACFSLKLNPQGHYGNPGLDPTTSGQGEIELMKDKEGIAPQHIAPFSRRNILLGGATLVAVSTFGASTPTTVSQT